MSSTSARPVTTRANGSAWASTHDGQVGDLTTGRGDVGHRERPSPVPPGLGEAVVHPHVEGTRAVEEAHAPAERGEVAGQRDVVGEVGGRRGEAARPQRVLRAGTPCTARWPSWRAARRGRTDPGGPKRYTSVVSIEACTSCWRCPSQRKRAPTLRKSQPSAWHRRTIAASSPGRGTVSASSVTTQVVVAAARPCCSAQGLPIHPLGTGPPVTTSAPAARATSAVASVLSSSTTTSRCGVGSHGQGVEQRADPPGFVAGRDHHRHRALGQGRRIELERGPGPRRASQPGRGHGRRRRGGHRATRRATCRRRGPPPDAHQPSSPTRPATISALMATSGSPPPGWLEPPTR